MDQHEGWIRDDDAVDAVTAALSAEAGSSIIVSQSTALADDGLPLRGFAKRQVDRGVTGVFPFRSEKRIRGKHQPSWWQRRGTCAAQGPGRMAQDAWYNELVNRGAVGRPVEIAYEATYGLGRVQIGKGQLGRAHPGNCQCGRCPGDGLVVAWAIAAMVKYGLTPRGVHGRYDLSKPAEHYAIDWGQPGVGTPPEVIAAGANIRVRAFRCLSGDDVADCAAAGFLMSHGYSSTYTDMNASGIAKLTRPSNHATEDGGFAVTPAGEWLIGGQQSWGPHGPKGATHLKYKGGIEELRPGSCFFPLEDADRAIRNGAEWFAIQFEHGQGFRPE
ncbi:hypothetical protein SH668x_001250 [Planctomicrobium sp. SH668]|uniref:hypothetical protein n=1 Tax=Planctomicrobium sp. SH668 TaxID=3448126 RepID=UPI003F5AEB27